MLPHHEINLRNVGLAGALRTRARRVQDLLKGNRRLVGWLRQLAQADVLDGYVDLVSRRVGEEGLQRPRLLVMGDRCVGERGFQEEERVSVFSLDSGPNPAEVLHDE